MSDISILSGRYEAISGLSTNLNEAALILKKAALKADHPQTSNTRMMDWSEVEEARNVLYNFLEKLIAAFDGRLLSETAIPYSLGDAFQKLSQNDPYFVQELRDLHQRLAGQQNLTQESFETLDKLLSVVDADASAVFRKLWRKR